MKKFLFLFVLLFPIFMCAQNVEILKKRLIKADELTETQEAIIWESEHISIRSFADGKTYIYLKCKDHIFMDGPFKVGFYDNNNNLVLNITWHTKLGDDNQNALLVDNGFIDTKIDGVEEIGNNRYLIPTKVFVDYVFKNTGYIRFVTRTYGGYTYDIRAVLEK